MAKILLVDDDEGILDISKTTLEQAGHDIVCAINGDEAERRLDKEAIDLVLLDIMMPGISGIELCRKWRLDEKKSNIPIIMLSGQNTEDDIVMGLDAGADDYIEKPFRAKELIARVKTAIRRSSDDLPELEDKKTIEIDKKTFRVFVKGELVERLTMTEFKIIEFLSKKPGWVFTREKIVAILKGQDRMTTRAIDVYVRGLRKKLGENSYLIESVRGVGYSFKDEFVE